MPATLDASAQQKLDDLVSPAAFKNAPYWNASLSARIQRAVDIVKQLAPYSDICQFKHKQSVLMSIHLMLRYNLHIHSIQKPRKRVT
jgi:hypothetical protein